MSDPLRYYRFESFLAAEGWPVTDGWCREPRDDSDKRGRVLRYRHLRSVYQSAWMRSIGLPSPRLLLPGMPCPSSVIDR